MCPKKDGKEKPMKKQKTTYPPLDYVRAIASMPPDEWGYGFLKTHLGGSGVVDGIDEKEFTHYLSDLGEFLLPTAPPHYRALNEFMFQVVDEILPRDVTKAILHGQADLRSELKDIFLAPELWMRWNKNKQVYRPDAEFASALLETEELQLTRDQLEHLPVNDFYIDLSDCGDAFAPVIGGLVSVELFPKSCAITIYLLTKQADVTFSMYSGGEYDEKGMLSLSMPRMEREIRGNDTFEVYTPFGRLRSDASPAVSRKRMSVFCIQILCYLTSKRPDIRESPLTRSTYRPAKTGQTMRQRWSEVEMHDVGVYYGTTIRTMRNKQETKPEANQEDTPDRQSRGERKSPRPHFRRAHWQHYWTGKGRTVCEVVWCAPSFVGHAPDEVTVHKMV